MAPREAGFFRELRHGRPDGPSLREALGGLPPDLRERARRYLESATVLVASSAVVDDVLDPERTAVATSDLRSDGAWMWPGDLAYYVGTYGAALPPELLAAMESNGWTAPELPAERVMAIARELYEQATGGG